MPWLHKCPALPKRLHRSQMVLIPDDSEMCGNCGLYRHIGRTVAVPADGGAMIDPLARASAQKDQAAGGEL